MEGETTILKDEKVRAVLERMRARCATREYCTSDIREKISKLLTDDIVSDESLKEKATAAIISSLTEDEFLSDRRYAAAFARDKSYLLGWGPQKIRHALLSKRIDEDIINGALASVNENAASNQLERILRRKLTSLDKKRGETPCGQAAEMERNDNIRAKLIRFGLGRGYSYDAVISALAKIEF